MLLVSHSSAMASGEMIRATRKALGESQREFGKRFGVDQSTVARWENDGLPRRGLARVAVERELKNIRNSNSAGSCS